ncbi:hypothetical protein OSTOST_15615 [Ostertagia ostertagi]
MFNEKIFSFLYYWFILVGILTHDRRFNPVAYSTRFNSQKIQFVRKFIKSTADEEEMMDDFCVYQVNSDMIVILNMIGAHANDVISCEVLQQMWKNYKDAILESYMANDTSPKKNESNQNSPPNLFSSQETNRASEIVMIFTFPEKQMDVEESRPLVFA